MKTNRWLRGATLIKLTTTIFVFVMAVLLAYAWRKTPTAKVEQNGVATNHSGEVVSSQPRSFKKAQMEFERTQVKGAPFSAELTVETKQYSADGNSWSAVLPSFIYRDDNGRVRLEQKTEANSGAGEVATINDFVGGFSYILEPRRQVARKKTLKAGSDDSIDESLAPNSAKSNSRYQVLPPGTTSSGSDSSRSTVSTTSPSVTKDSLGEQLIEGIKVEGTKLTTTIPANSFGNPQPIVIVDEQWYSPELRTMVLIKYSDPRFGDSFYRLKNITRTDPSPDLFVVPPKYAVKDELTKQP